MTHGEEVYEDILRSVRHDIVKWIARSQRPNDCAAAWVPVSQEELLPTAFALSDRVSARLLTVDWRVGKACYELSKEV